MHEWFDPQIKLPADGQECLLRAIDRGMITTPIFGPIMWSQKNNCWLDIFSSPEAGTVVTPDLVGLWCDWESIAPETPKEAENEQS